MIELKIGLLIVLVSALALTLYFTAPPNWARQARIELVKARFEEMLTVTILTATLALIWGGILTLTITLLAHGLGV